MTDPVCPKTGAPMHRAARPVALTYKGLELTFDMPGWYCAASDESIHTGEDMKVSDRALNRLKDEAEGLSSPEDIEEYHHLKGRDRAVIATADAPAEIIEAVRNATMDARHDHLNDLLKDWTP